MLFFAKKKKREYGEKTDKNQQIDIQLAYRVFVYFLNFLDKKTVMRAP